MEFRIGTYGAKCRVSEVEVGYVFKIGGTYLLKIKVASHFTNKYGSRDKTSFLDIETGLVTSVPPDAECGVVGKATITCNE